MKVKGRVKNAILKTVSSAAYFILMYCFCCVDTPNIKPFLIPMAICGGWLALFCYANCVWEGGEHHAKNQ